MIKLTLKQEQILDFIRAHLAEEDRVPTRLEIATHFGFKSQNAAQSHINYLIDKKKLEVRGCHYRLAREVLA